MSGCDIVKDVIRDAGDHAAKRKTSLLMALRTDCADMSRLPEGQNIPLLGVRGTDPRGTASEEFGEFAVKTLVDRIVSHVPELLEREE